MVLLDNDYSIVADKMDYTLYRKRITVSGKNAGREYQDVVGYYASFEQALNAYSKERVRDKLMSEDYKLKDAIAAILKSNEELKAIISRAIGGKDRA